MNNVSSTALATRHMHLGISSSKNPTRAIVFAMAAEATRLAHFSEGAKSIVRATNNHA